uniref:Uncharacterized protein n=1 Tax=Romanomermis culicivorax TaxID=13658 RepID=A0A915HRR7_ROMCU
MSKLPIFSYHLNWNKKQTKTEVSEFRVAQQSTGAGPPPMELSNIHQKIYDLIPAHFERIENEFDDDTPSFKTGNRFASVIF